MKKIKKNILLIGLVVFALTLSGCVTVQNGSGGQADGGLYKSPNKGVSWQQKTLIPTTTGKPRTFSGVNNASLFMDPSDRKAIYYGSVENGLFFTYDGGENWQLATTLGKVTVRSLAVDPVIKCIIYATVGNKLFKSSDCSRTWVQTYYDSDLTVTVDAVAVDPADGQNVLIGVSRGDIIKSYNRGGEWQTIYRVEDRIKKIIIDPSNSRNIYVLTAKKGVFVTTDGGQKWDELTPLTEAMKELKVSDEIKDVIVIKGTPGLIFLATASSILKSKNNGQTWEKIELIPDSKKVPINAIAVNEENVNEIYYVTNTTFYSSPDGGQNWKPIKMPSTRAGWKLLLDPEDQNIIYMGVQSFQK